MTPTLSAEEMERELIARAIWSVRREYEDRCDMELEDLRRNHSVWLEADAVRATLARQPQPVELEVWGNKYRVNFMGQEFLCSDPKGRIVTETIPLCRLSDAQRLLAERDARIEALTEYAAAVEKSADKAEQERDQLLARVGELEQLLGGCLVYATRMEPMNAKLMNAIDAALTQPSGGKEEEA